MRKQELSLIINGLMILAVISVFFILIFLSSNLREENMDTLYSLHNLYVRISTGSLDAELEKEELSRLLDGAFPGRMGHKLQGEKERIIDSLEKGKAGDTETGYSINKLIGLYKTLIQYRDEVIQAFFYFLIIAIGLQSLIFTLSLKQVFSYRQKMAERERYLLQLQDMQEQERQDLAAYLHDNVLQDLGALNLILADDEQRKILQTCTSRIRRLSYSFVPAHLDSMGLDNALEDLGNQFFNDSPCQFTIHRFGYIDQDIGNHAKQLLYRISREALNNVYKHAEASQVELILTRMADKLVMKIEDNGEGFPVNRKKEATDTGGLGLFMVSLLANRLRAELSITSTPGEGTCIRTVYFISEDKKA